MSESKGTVVAKGSVTGNLQAVFGRDGKSAYEVAVKNGFEGTEAEWVESLKGIYIGSGDMPDEYVVQIDPDGEVLTDDIARDILSQIKFIKNAEALKEQNKSGNFTVWVGTQEEYDGISEKVQDCFYIITDDNSRNEIIDETKQSLGDYIVEQGTSGALTYRKWHSGIAECWGNITRTASNWNASNLFSGGGVYTVVNEPFPFEFKSVKSVVANCIVADDAAVTYSVCSECLVKQSVAVNAHTNHTGEQICQTTVIVKGRWK